MVLDFRTELLEVSNSALAVGGRDNGLGVEAEVGGNHASCCLDGGDGVGQDTIYIEENIVASVKVETDIIVAWKCCPLMSEV